MLGDKENFLDRVSEILKSLHTITFSQIAATYLQRMAMAVEHIDKAIVLKKEELASQLDTIINDINVLVKEGKLPSIDEYLLDSNYRHKKLKRFLKFCIKKGYIEKIDGYYMINVQRVLASFHIKSYRKENPVGFTANEFLSINYNCIMTIYEKYCNTYKVSTPIR
jgi:uncharacterized protein YlaN (UPF0358 family)